MKTNLFKTFQPFINRCKKSSLPILGFVKVENGTATITDSETWVEFNTDLPDGMYNVINGETFKSTADPEDFPVLKLGSTNARGFVNKYDILALSTCTSSDKLRPVMQGIHLTNEHMVATNSHILRWITRDIEDSRSEFNDIFIPSTALLSYLKSSDDELKVTTFFAPEENSEQVKHIQFAFSDCLITQRVVDGVYPNWKSCVPEHKGNHDNIAAMVLSVKTINELYLTAKAFKGSKMVRVYADKMSIQNTDLELEKQFPIQFCEPPERKPDAVIMPMHTDGDGILAFNAEFLYLLKNIHTRNVIISWEPEKNNGNLVTHAMLVWFENLNETIHLLDGYKFATKAIPQSLPEPAPIPVPEPEQETVPEPAEVPEPEQEPTPGPVPEPATPTEGDGHCEGGTTAAPPTPSETEQPDTESPQSEIPIPQSAITILSYSDRSIIVVGPTKQFKDAFKAAWGRWSVNLKHPETGQVTKGWVFSNKRKAQIEQILNAA